MPSNKITNRFLIELMEAVDSASSESQCATAIMTAAALVQKASKTDDGLESLYDAQDAVPAHLTPALDEVINRAINFHVQDDGSVLGLWLLPVILKHPGSLPSAIPLIDSPHRLRFSAFLQSQLGLKSTLTEDPYSSAPPTPGWVFPLNTLFSRDHIRKLDLGSLMRIPSHVQEIIRGVEPSHEIDYLRPTQEKSGVFLYFLPVVTKHLSLAKINQPKPCHNVKTHFENWITSSLKANTGFKEEPEIYCNASVVPGPFSEALAAGDDARFQALFINALDDICEKRGLTYNGLSAYIAPYIVQNRKNQLRIGVSLISRLTNEFVSAITLPASSEDGFMEINLLSDTMVQLNMNRVMACDEPIHTYACQQCGHVQLERPTTPPEFQLNTEPPSLLH